MTDEDAMRTQDLYLMECGFSFESLLEMDIFEKREWFEISVARQNALRARKG